MTGLLVFTNPCGSHSSVKALQQLVTTWWGETKQVGLLSQFRFSTCGVSSCQIWIPILIIMYNVILLCVLLEISDSYNCLLLGSYCLVYFSKTVFLFLLFSNWERMLTVGNIFLVMLHLYFIQYREIALIWKRETVLKEILNKVAFLASQDAIEAMCVNKS